MIEATKRPWYATGIHVQSAAINEDNYVCTAEGNSPEQAIANADLIVKAVNSHDALVAALEAAIPMLTPATRTIGGTKRARLAAEAALEQVK